MIVLVVFVVVVEDVDAVVAAALRGRPLGDFFWVGVVSAFAPADLTAAAVDTFAGLLGAAGGFSSFRLADFGRPFALAFGLAGDAFPSSTIGEGLRLRPGDFRVPRRVATS